MKEMVKYLGQNKLISHWATQVVNEALSMDVETKRGKNAAIFQTIQWWQ